MILVNGDTPGLRWGNARSGDYDAQQILQPPGRTPVSFGRGWAAIDAKYRGRRFRFVNTHLEVEDFADVQEAQAHEFLDGPARIRAPRSPPATSTRRRTQHHGPRRHPHQPVPGRLGVNAATRASAAARTRPSPTRRRRATTGSTSCSSTGRRHRSRPTSSATPRSGAEPRRRPIWASDHAGVVSTLRLR